MKDNNQYNQKQRTESLRQALIKSGYDMAASQVENMFEDQEYWNQYMVDGKINPKCIDIDDQEAHSFYNNEMDIWFTPDKDIFPEGCGEGGINELIEVNGISDDEVFALLNEGAAKFINEQYGEGWKDKFPEPEYK